MNVKKTRLLIINVINITILICTIVFFTSCASQKYTKKGLQYEQNGLNTEAADFYFLALTKKIDNIDAKLGLKRTGQIVLNQMLKKFDEVYNIGNNTLAVQEYQKASQYYNKLNHFNIDLNFPIQYHQYYEEAKTSFLEEKYIKANQFLAEEQFKEAETLYREILSYNASYKDAQEKLKTAICEPIYRNIIQLMTHKKYRAAYTAIGRLQKNYNYKDITDLKTECLEEGRIVIIFAPIKTTYYKQEQEINQILRINIIHQLQNLNDPFLKISEDITTSLKGKKIIEFQCDVKSFIYNAGNLSSTKTKGWIRETTIDNDEEIHINYKKIYYYLYNQSRSLSFNFNFQLSDLRNHEIFSSNSKDIIANDKIYYAYFDGNKKNLVQGYWKYKLNILDSKYDKIEDNPYANSELQNLLKARKTIKDYQTLLNEACNQAISLASNDIINYISYE